MPRNNILTDIIDLKNDGKLSCHIFTSERNE